MTIAILGTNGMLSSALTKFYLNSEIDTVDVYGLEAPCGYGYNKYFQIDLLNDKLKYEDLCSYDVIVYASGAGVQAALQTDPMLMYKLNLYIPIEITQQLKSHNYKGLFVSFGSYMEIGVNDEEGKAFVEEEIVCSQLSVTNDYGLSKRLYSRYMKDFAADFHFYHFILPNMFSEDDMKPGTRLVPYTLKYLQEYVSEKNPPSPRYSEGLQKRQFITLEEMISTADKAIRQCIPSGIYNIGGGEYLNIRSLIERLFAIYDVPCREEYFGKETRRDGDIKSLRIDGNKLYKKIGLMPSATIEEIFRR